MVSYNARKWMFIIALFSIICVATLLILQITTRNNNTSYQTIEMLPSFQVRIEWLHLSVVILYTTGLISSSSQHIHWYFIPLGVFVAVQLIYSTWLLLDRDSYIQEQLELSWQDAYSENLNKSDILRDIQEQWQCQGFKTMFDRPALVETAFDHVVMGACYPILAKAYGSTVFIWGIGLWVVKLIQAIGLLACYALYIHINYTFISNGGSIILEDMETNALISFSDDDSDSDIDSFMDNDDDDDTTIIVLSAVNEEKVHLNSVEQQ